MFRTLLMKGFHFLVWFLCVRGVKDTQCGFKLLSRSAAAALFVSLHVERWAFDVELLYIAQCLGMQLREVAVRWQEIEGKNQLVMFRDPSSVTLAHRDLGKTSVLTKAIYLKYCVE